MGNDTTGGNSRPSRQLLADVTALVARYAGQVAADATLPGLLGDLAAIVDRGRRAPAAQPRGRHRKQRTPLWPRVTAALTELFVPVYLRTAP